MQRGPFQHPAPHSARQQSVSNRQAVDFYESVKSGIQRMEMGRRMVVAVNAYDNSPEAAEFSYRQNLIIRQFGNSPEAAEFRHQRN